MELKFGEGIVGEGGATGVAEIVKTRQPTKTTLSTTPRGGQRDGRPILCDGNVIGVIDSEHTLKGFFQPHHLRVMQASPTFAAKIGRSLGEQRIQEFAKFFQLNPNPVARIANDGEILLR